MDSVRLQFIIECIWSSRLRENALRYLREHPEGMKASEITRDIHTDASSFTGIMIGNGRKFSKEKALIVLGLVRREKTNGKYRYYITENGILVLEHLDQTEQQ